MYADFVDALKALGAKDQVCDSVRKEINSIQESGSLVRGAVDEYLNGFPHRAYRRFEDALRILQPFLEKLQAPRNQLENLYRIRTFDDLAQKERAEIFHVPFQMRHKVRSQRYSISGLPSLYLGASLLVCWEEVGRPAFHTLSVAAFKATGNVSVLDFGYRPRVFIDLHQPQGNDMPSFFDNQQVQSYLVCWPLLAACAIHVSHRGESFVEEYIIPQLLLQWLRQGNAGFDGVRYFSTRVEQSSSAPFLAVNYVFPVKVQAHTGYCTELIKKFELSLPVPWVLLEGTDVPVRSPLRTDAEFVFNSELLLRYDDTVFKKLESRIAVCRKEKIS